MKDIEQIKEWHQYVIIGLNNGLTHVSRDERLNDIVWVRKRLELFESFSRCIMGLVWGNETKYDERRLKEVAMRGYRLHK